MFRFRHHGIGPSLPSQVPGWRPSTAPSSPLSSVPPSSLPLASSWLRLLPLGLSGPPWPRCTLPVLSQHTSRQGVDIDRQWAQEDVQILVSQSIVKYVSHIYVYRSNKNIEKSESLPKVLFTDHSLVPTNLTSFSRSIFFQPIPGEWQNV